MEPLSRQFLLNRGYCCENGCLNCPYKEKDNMTRLIDRCYVAKSDLHGYGVFADENIKKDDVVTECVIPEQLIPKNTYMMRDYRWAWRHPDDEITYEDDFLPMGKASIVNCNNFLGQGGGRVPIKENITWELDKPNRLLKAIATRDIKKDDEILWSYGFENIPDLKPDPIS